jgi:beta-1,2-mannobiose phosphorylase / 1,2-beta-oligomannan phosphorylase
MPEITVGKITSVITLALGCPLVICAARSLPETTSAVDEAETSAGWVKYEKNPVLGGKLGTCFDASVLKDGSTYRMWFSWRPRKSIAVTESKDGVTWSQPQVVLPPLADSGWEDDINRPGVVKVGGIYHMWYTGQSKGRSRIGYATSPDGKTWKRMNTTAVLSAEARWEKVAVMCPHVLWDETRKQFRMWYSGGEQNEPNAIGYATSPDGLHWSKHAENPIFEPARTHDWEKHKVTGCHVEKRGDWFVMFFIGFRDEPTAQIGIARSKDGVSGWQRHPDNPIIRLGRGRWDHDACYKPSVLFDGDKWWLWYNGRHGELEQIGLAWHQGEDLGF